MNSSAPLLVFLNGCAVLLLAWAALHDLAARTVPNVLPAAVLAIAVCLRLMDHAVLPSLGVAACTFLLLFAVWCVGGIGGGDVKLWSASVVLIPPHFQAEFYCFSRILLGGGILALIYLSLHLAISRPRASRSGRVLTRILRAEAWRISKKAPLPYAFAIAGGTIVTLLPLSFSALR